MKNEKYGTLSIHFEFNLPLRMLQIKWFYSKFMVVLYFKTYAWGQSYKANFGINYIQNGLNKLNFHEVIGWHIFGPELWNSAHPIAGGNTQCACTRKLVEIFNSNTIILTVHTSYYSVKSYSVLKFYLKLHQFWCNFCQKSFIGLTPGCQI